MERIQRTPSSVANSVQPAGDIPVERLDTIRRQSLAYVLESWEVAFKSDLPAELVERHLQIGACVHAVVCRELADRVPDLDYQGLFDACRNAFIYLDAAKGTTGLDAARIDAAKHELSIALDKHDSQLQNIAAGLPPKF